MQTDGLRQYDDFVNCQRGDVVGQSGTTLTRRIRLETPREQDVYYLKVYCYNGRSWRHRSSVGPWPRQDKAFTEARNYRILQTQCDVLVPDVVCHGCRRQRSGWVDAFILTRGVPGAVPLDSLVADRWPDPHSAFDDPTRRHLLRSTARIVAKMHATGFYHVDLQWRNLLVANSERPEPPVYVIDSTRGDLRRWRVYRAHGQLRDLSSLYKQARVWMTPTEQLRWLRDYLDAEKVVPERAKTKNSTDRTTARAILWTILLDRSIKDNDGSA